MEVGVSTLAGCLVTLRPLLRRVAERVEGSSNYKGCKSEIASPNVKRSGSRDIELSKLSLGFSKHLTELIWNQWVLL